jgi:hypothetical protein
MQDKISILELKMFFVFIFLQAFPEIRLVF